MTKKQSHSETAKEHWMNSRWRPACGWMYIVICLFDFMIAPILWSITQALFHGGVNVQWQPLTLQGAGLFHVAMGAIIGVSAYGRTQEKLGGANNGGLTQLGQGTTYVPPVQAQVNVNKQPGLGGGGFGGDAYGNTTTSIAGFPPGSATFGSVPTAGVVAPSGFGSPGTPTAANWEPAAAAVTAGWGGKKAPPTPVFPEL